VTRHSQRVNIGGIVPDVECGIEIVFLDQLTEYGTFVNFNRGAQFKYHAPPKQVQIVFVGDGFQDRAEGFGSSGWIFGLSVVDRKGRPFVFNQHTRQHLRTQPLAGSFKIGAKACRSRCQNNFLPIPPLKAMIADIHKPGKTDTLANVIG